MSFEALYEITESLDDVRYELNHVFSFEVSFVFDVPFLELQDFFYLEILFEV